MSNNRFVCCFNCLYWSQNSQGHLKGWCPIQSELTHKDEDCVAFIYKPHKEKEDS